MDDYTVRAAVLAGGNKGKALEREMKEKGDMAKVMKTKYLPGSKLFYDIENPQKRSTQAPEKTVLGATLDAIVDCEYVDVANSIVTTDLPYANTIGLESKVPIQDQTGNCLYDTLTQSLHSVYADGYNGDVMIVCGDLPASVGSDYSEFIANARKFPSDLAVGMIDFDKAKKFYEENESVYTSGDLKKGIIPFMNDTGAFNGLTPNLHYANVFLVSRKFYDEYTRLEDSLKSVLELKKVFNNSNNFGTLAEILKDDDKKMWFKPWNHISLAGFVLRKSTIGRRLFIENYLKKCNDISPNKTVRISEIEDLLSRKLLNKDVVDDSHKLIGKLVEAPYMFAFDADTNDDLAIVSEIRKLRKRS